MRPKSTARRSFHLIGAAAALLMTVALASCTPALTPTADYQFNSTLAACGNDAPTLTVLGSGSFANESVDGKTWKVRRFTDNSGVRLSPTTNEVSNSSVYTIALLFRFSAPTGYTRIVDFKNGTSDHGLYADSGSLYFYPWSGGTSAKVGTTFSQVVLTRDSNKLVVGYVDGQKQFSFTDSTNDGVITNNVLRFFQDNTTGGASTEASPGAIARLRLFNKALTADQVKNLTQLPASPCSTT